MEHTFEASSCTFQYTKGRERKLERERGREGGRKGGTRAEINFTKRRAWWIVCKHYRAAYGEMNIATKWCKPVCNSCHTHASWCTARASVSPPLFRCCDDECIEIIRTQHNYTEETDNSSLSYFILLYRFIVHIYRLLFQTRFSFSMDILPSNTSYVNEKKKTVRSGGDHSMSSSIAPICFLILNPEWIWHWHKALLYRACKPADSERIIRAAVFSELDETIRTPMLM